MPTRGMLSVGSLCNPREPAQPATALRPELGTEGGRPAPDVEQAAVTSDVESKEDASKKEEQGAAALSELFAWIGPAGTQKLLTARCQLACAHGQTLHLGMQPEPARKVKQQQRAVELRCGAEVY